ncbi:hypothetical protein DP065_00255 [[Mycoplasma] anseris]|uniref:Uncharacterized protein n=1 Tax=[Mycoplasma] anseris TaxID=92400 RepID=A0A2Z4NCG4_9BACT|nr:hypothetical protein DP065_00255 [[Mycoplasma] anseris]
MIDLTPTNKKSKIKIKELLVNKRTKEYYKNLKELLIFYFFYILSCIISFSWLIYLICILNKSSAKIHLFIITLFLLLSNVIYRIILFFWKCESSFLISAYLWKKTRRHRYRLYFLIIASLRYMLIGGTSYGAPSPSVFPFFKLIDNYIDWEKLRHLNMLDIYYDQDKDFRNN